MISANVVRDEHAAPPPLPVRPALTPHAAEARKFDVAKAASAKQTSKTAGARLAPSLPITAPPALSDSPGIAKTVTFPAGKEQITPERAARRIVQQIIGGNDLYPDQVDEIMRRCNVQVPMSAAQLAASVTTGGDRRRALTLYVSPQDLADMQQAKYEVLAEAEQVRRIFDNMKHNNEAAKFVSGFYDGGYGAVESTIQTGLHPIDTATALGAMLRDPFGTGARLKEALGDKYDEFVRADALRRSEMLGNLTGEVVVGIVGAKGFGAATKAARATRAGIAIEQRVTAAAGRATQAARTAMQEYGQGALVRTAVVLDEVLERNRQLLHGALRPSLAGMAGVVAGAAERKSLHELLTAPLEARVQSRINVRVGDGTTGSGFDYAMRRHGGTHAPNKSQFSIPHSEVADLLRRKDVVGTPAIKDPLSGNYIREAEVGQIIGRTPLAKGGHLTSIITVITDEAGNLVNVFPGRLNYGAK